MLPFPFAKRQLFLRIKHTNHNLKNCDSWNIKELLFAGWCTSIINLKLATGAETSLLTLSRTWQHAQIQVKLNSKWRHRLCCPRAGWRLAAAWLALVVRQRQDTQTRLIYSNTYGQCSEHVTLFALLEHWVNWKVHAQKKRWKKKWCWECSTFCYIWICAFFFFFLLNVLLANIYWH